MKRFVPFLFSLGLLNCRAEQSSKATETTSSSEANENKDKAKDTQTPAANPFAGLGPLGAIMGAKLDEPGPYDEPKQSPGWDKDTPYVAVLELKGVLSELAPVAWWNATEPTIELRLLTKQLRDLANDAKVAGLILRFSQFDTDMASAEELRASLLEFRQNTAKKPLLCHAEGVSNQTYYVMTACDQIVLEPLSEVVISGIAATPFYVKDLLAKIGVYADFVQIGAYKGAAEPLTRNGPSPEMQKTIEAIVDTYYQEMISAIQQQRQLAQEDVEKLIDQAIFYGNGAMEAKLVDGFKTYPQFLVDIVGTKEWKKVKFKPHKQAFDFSELQRFLGLLPPQKPKEPHVAVIYAVGNIIDGEGQGTIGAREQIAGRTLSAAIRTMAADPLVSAIVLRINSGGGSAKASEQIWAEVNAAKTQKPVIVSMGRVAASGGYYIAADATKIYASASTLTGSIGVIGGKIVLGDALEKLGIHIHPIVRGKRALMWSPFTSWQTDEKAVIQAMMETVYKQFVERVAQGRGKTYDSVHEIAQGRVWTGRDAKELDLIDEIGGLDQAITEARKLANIGERVELEIYPPEPTLKDLLHTIGEVSLPYGLQTIVHEIQVHLGVRESLVVKELLTNLMLLRTENVQTMNVFPVMIQ